METGTILITESIEDKNGTKSLGKTTIYTRVSVAENKDSLKGQAKRMKDYCTAKVYQVSVVVKEMDQV